MMNHEDMKAFCLECLKLNALDEYAKPEFVDCFILLINRLLTVNETMNLTAIREPREAIVKHLADSLTVARFIPQDSSLLDVGCGGGFPSLPLAIARPDLTVTALDSTAKKTNYVLETAKLVGLTNVSILTGRAENFGHQPSARESFDCVVSRAVASLPALCELCLPLVKPKGIMIAMKSRADEDSAMQATRKLGGSPFREITFELYGNPSPEFRRILISTKENHTPSLYPRIYSQIKNKPLL